MIEKNGKPTFIKNAISARKALGLNVYEFADLAQIAHSTMLKIEAGISLGSQSTKEKIAKALNTTVDKLNTPQDFISSPRGNSRSETITSIVTALPSLKDADLSDVLNLISTRLKT
jgi:transcriptional regulator with XRE-family HTH domain